MPIELATKDFSRTTLRPRHRPVARAIAEALMSPDGEASAARLDAFVDDLDAFISPASKTLRFGFLAMLTIMRWSPLLYGRFRTFEELTVDERIAHMHKLEASKVAQLPLIVVAYKTVMSMLYYEDEAELRALGYPGPERHRWKKGLPMAPAASSAPPVSTKEAAQ